MWRLGYPLELASWLECLSACESVSPLMTGSLLACVSEYRSPYGSVSLLVSLSA